MSLIDRLKEKNGKEFAKQVIQEYMKKKKFDTIEELLKDNGTLVEFNQNTKMENLVSIIQKHGCNITEQDYQEIIEQIKLELDEKKALKMNEEVEYINGHKIVTLTDEQTGQKKTVLDDLSPDTTVTEEAQKIQNENKQFQSTKENNNNTLGVMEKLENDVKITPDTINSEEAKRTADTKDEEIIAQLVNELEKELGHEVQVDFNSKIIYDYYDDTKYTIEENSKEYMLVKQESGPKLVKTNTSNKAA